VSLTLKDGGADYPFVGNGHDHGLAVDIDLIKPDFDLVTIEKVFLQKGAVFLGNVLEEVPYFGAILRYKRSQGHRSSITKSNALWIGGEQIARYWIIGHGINPLLSNSDYHRCGVRTPWLEIIERDYLVSSKRFDPIGESPVAANSSVLSYREFAS
jgi:hypothetical protein